MADDNDLVTRLRRVFDRTCWQCTKDAADEIERLWKANADLASQMRDDVAEIERLRAKVADLERQLNDTLAKRSQARVPGRDWLE